MEEKTLIQSDQYNAKIIIIAFIILGILLPLNFFITNLDEKLDWIDTHMNDYYITYEEHQEAGSCGKLYGNGGLCHACKFVNEHPSKFLYALDFVIDSRKDEMFITAVSISAFGVVIYLWLRSYELTVTNKRVLGRVLWVKRVDLPIDSVSAISTINLLKAVSVSTSSGRISFLFLKNANEIYEVINDLIITRQKQNKQMNESKSADTKGSADELKKYKELLDSGVISQEEFDAKKKQLLGL